MIRVSGVTDLPNTPAVYALYGGQSAGRYVAYVGVADKLKQRLTQHLVRRDSSITTGTSAVSLNPDAVTEARWWEHAAFAERTKLEAAEIVAFDVLQPVLRSRGGITKQAAELQADEHFVTEMRRLFSQEPTGILSVPSLDEALARISNLEHRVAELEARLRDRP